MPTCLVCVDMFPWPTLLRSFLHNKGLYLGIPVSALSQARGTCVSCCPKFVLVCTVVDRETYLVADVVPRLMLHSYALAGHDPAAVEPASISRSSRHRLTRPSTV